MSISNRNFPILGSARSNDVSRVLAHPMVPGYSLTKPIKTMTIGVKIRHFSVKTNKKYKASRSYLSLRYFTLVFH